MGKVAQSPGDGYTILLASSSIVVNPSLYAKVPYDIDKDFIPVTKAGGTPNSWVVNASFPAKTMKELIDLIKREPGKHSVGSPGAGTTPSLSIDMLRLALKLDFITVPFAGGGPMTTSLLGGHTPIVCSRARQLREPDHARASCARSRSPPSKRSAALPDIPTLEEFGIKGQDAETMTGVFVPAGTPQSDRRPVAAGILGDRERARHQGEAPGARRRGGGQFAGGLRRLCARRSRQVAEGDRGRQDRKDLAVGYPASWPGLSRPSTPYFE